MLTRACQFAFEYLPPPIPGTGTRFVRTFQKGHISSVGGRMSYVNWPVFTVATIYVLRCIHLGDIVTLHDFLTTDV